METKETKKPRGRPTKEVTLSNAERQAAHRLRVATERAEQAQKIQSWAEVLGEQSLEALTLFIVTGNGNEAAKRRWLEIGRRFNWI